MQDSAICAAAGAFVRSCYPSLDDLALNGAIVCSLLSGWLVRVGMARGFFVVSVVVERSGAARRPVEHELAIGAEQLAVAPRLDWHALLEPLPVAALVEVVSIAAPLAVLPAA